MSVTVTRKTLMQYGEDAITEAGIRYGIPSTGIDATGFRKVLATTLAVARGGNSHDGVDCPMIQAGADLERNDPACYLAICWDRVTRDNGLSGARVIDVNPFT